MRTATQTQEPKSKTLSTSPYFAGMSGTRGGGSEGGDGSSGFEDDNFSGSFPPDKSRIITAFLLLVVLMTFGGLTAAYVLVAQNRFVEWRPFEFPVQIWVSTTFILASSLTYHIAKVSFDRSKQDRAKRWLVMTTALGGAFISSQLVVWLVLVRRGVYLSGNPYATFFYVLTAAHAVHLAGGIAALGWILLRSWRPSSEAAELAYRRALSRSIGWYWHFMGLLWVALFIILAFWR